jgi:hypothetical protein
MTKYELKNAKINLAVELTIKRDRFAKGLKTPGVDTAAIQRIIDATQAKIDELDREIAILAN